MAGKKRLGMSKNRKKYWKSHVNLEDVTQYLEEEEKDAILGGPVQNKTNSELFFVDKEVDDQKNKAKSKENWKNKTLKCHQILNDYSKVPIPIKPFQQNKKFKKSKTLNVEPKLKSDKQQATAKGKDNKVHSAVGSYDLWDTCEPSISNGLLDEQVEDYYKRQLKIKGRKMPDLFYKKPSILPAIEFPKPGASYNPTFEDHQKLLGDAHEVEVAKLKEERRLSRALDEKFPRLHQAPTAETWLNEMSQGIMGDATRDSDEEDIDCTAPLTLNPPVRCDKRKSANKRRREKRLREEAKKVELKKLDLVKENEIYRIRSIKEEVMEEKYQIQMNLLWKKIKEKSRAHLPATLSRYKYQNPDLELKLSEELTGSLRTLKAEGSVIHDRYKSFQRRNIIESRIKQKKTKRKHRLKKFLKRGYEDV